jgi:hypothetical protein
MTDLPISTADVSKEVKIRMGKDGQSAIPTTTVMKQFDKMVKKHGDKPALHQKVLKAVRQRIKNYLYSIIAGLIRGISESTTAFITSRYYSDS